MPGAGPLLRSDFPKLYAERLPYIDMLIGPDDWPEVDQQWERYFNIKSSSRMREEFLQYAGFGLFNSMSENDAVSYDQMVQGFQKTVSHVLFGKGFQIGFLSAKHDLDGIIARNSPELGRSLRMSIQTQAASFWNNAFDTETTADGKTVFATDHLFIRGGGSFSNRSATDATIGMTSLETGIVAFRKQKDLMGNPMPLPVSTLLTAPDLEPTVFELLQSRQRPDTTTNAMNFNFGKVTPETWPFLTITTAWHLLGPKDMLKIFWFWNIRPETDHGYDFDKSNAKTKTLYASSFVAVDPRGTYGSKGA